MTSRRRTRGRLLTDQARDLLVIAAVALGLLAAFGWAARDPGPERLPPHYSLRGY